MLQCLFFVFLLTSVTTTSSSEILQEVKLFDGDKPNEGFILIKTGQRWFYQCETTWGSRNSKVLCRDLGYSKIVETFNNSIVNKAIKGFIPFDDHGTYCESNERKLEECSRKRLREEWIHQHCGEGSQVYVVCHHNKDDDQLYPRYEDEKLEVRLHNNQIQDGIVSSGYLQIRDSGIWKDVCDDDWSLVNSLMACKQLGFPRVLEHVGGNRNDIDNPVFFTRTLKCNGSEVLLWQCLQDDTINKYCENSQSLYLKCGRMELEQKTKQKNSVVRLRGGYVESEGRVEMFKNGEWGTICDDGWDINDAIVICQQLGYGSPYEATHWAEHGEGIGKILVTNVMCTGNETSLDDCYSSTNVSSCTHNEDAGVRCRLAHAHIRQKIRLTGSINNNEGKIEYFNKGRWNGICGIGFSRQEGTIVCKQLGLGFAQWASRSYKYGINNRKKMYDVRCNGSETELSMCHHKSWGRCRYYDMASVKCSKYAPDLVMEISTFQQSIIIESHLLYELKCSYEEQCLAPIVKKLYYQSLNYKRKLLKFTSSFMNKGAISFRSNIPKDGWIWHSCHKHYHSMETFAVYDLIDNNGTRVADGHKASFCLEDTICLPGFQKMFNCTDKGDQGISVNCIDVYSNRIDCQWIDITEVKDGNYSLRVLVNPTRSVAESDYSNNRAVCALEYYHGDVRVKHCTTDACYQESFGGNSYGHCCTFPFIYNNKEHYKCITDDEPSSRPWCATTHDYDNDKRWGFCKERIPQDTTDTNFAL